MIGGGLAIGIPAFCVCLTIAALYGLWRYLGRDTGKHTDGPLTTGPRPPEISHEEYGFTGYASAPLATTGAWQPQPDVPGREPPTVSPAPLGGSAPAQAYAGAAHPAGDHCPDCGQPVTECPAEHSWGHRHATGCTGTVHGGEGIFHGPGAHLCGSAAGDHKPGAARLLAEGATPGHTPAPAPGPVSLPEGNAMLGRSPQEATGPGEPWYLQQDPPDLMAKVLARADQIAAIQAMSIGAYTDQLGGYDHETAWFAAIDAEVKA
jgi:hypothetical protein